MAWHLGGISLREWMCLSSQDRADLSEELERRIEDYNAELEDQAA